MSKSKIVMGKVSPNREYPQRAQNIFYRIIGKAQRKCQQKFLLGEKAFQKKDPSEVHSQYKNRCCKVLKYNQLRTYRTTLALQGPNNQVAVTIQAKKALARAHAFLKAPPSWGSQYKSGQRSAYFLFSQETIAKALFS